MWFGVLKLVLEIASAISQHMKDKQLLDAGQAIAINKNLTDALDKIKTANTARDNVVIDADSLHNDPNSRD